MTSTGDGTVDASPATSMKGGLDDVLAGRWLGRSPDAAGRDKRPAAAWRPLERAEKAGRLCTASGAQIALAAKPAAL